MTTIFIIKRGSKLILEYNATTHYSQSVATVTKMKLKLLEKTVLEWLTKIRYHYLRSLSII